MTRHQQKKYWGQNFLVDSQIIAQIIRTIAPQKNDKVLEIGVGMGALTQPLLSVLKQLVIVELDKDLVNYWRAKNIANLKIYQGDILKFDLSGLSAPLRIIGNLPYNISSPILFKMLEHRHLISDMCFMLQKEVVARIVAQPSRKAYGRLSVILQYYFDLTHCFNVPSTAFKPVPKVESAILTLRPKQQKVSVDYQNFQQIIKASFAMRRKKLINCLKSHLEPSQTQIDLNRRGEELSVEEFVQLTQDYEQQK